MCSLFRQVDEQGSDSDIPSTCAVTVGDEALPEGSTSRRQSLFVTEEGSEESDKSSSLDNESQVQLNRFLHLREVSPVCHTLSVPWNTTRERTKRRYASKKIKKKVRLTKKQTEFLTDQLQKGEYSGRKSDLQKV